MNIVMLKPNRLIVIPHTLLRKSSGINLIRCTDHSAMKECEQQYKLHVVHTETFNFIRQPIDINYTQLYLIKTFTFLYLIIK